MSLPPRLRRYRFRIGARVRLRGYAVTAMVLARSRTALGKEIYDVIMTGEFAGRPFRTFAGDGLEAVENVRKTRRDAAPLH